MIEEGDKTAEIQHECNSTRNAQAIARSFAKNGEAYLMQRKRKAAVDAGAGKRAVMTSQIVVWPC